MENDGEKRTEETSSAKHVVKEYVWWGRNVDACLYSTITQVAMY